MIWYIMPALQVNHFHTGNTMSALKVINAGKSFAGKQAVGNLNFTVDKGKAFCLLGGNGAGKSTTMNMLLGFLRPDQGELRFEDMDLWTHRARAREHIFYLPDQISLYPEFSATENLQYLASLSNLSITLDAIGEALSEVGLPSEAHTKRISEYSKGMRQKVALALARIKKPRLLLLDEPTSGLDPVAIKEFVNLIQSLKHTGASVVMVSHDLQCAHLLADDIGILQAGILRTQLANTGLTLDALEDQYFESAA